MTAIDVGPPRSLAAVSAAGAGRRQIQWQILGTVTATHAGAVLDLGAPRQRAVLAVLLSRAGETVRLSQIIDTVWGADPPRYAVNVVHKHIGGLRRVADPGLARRAQGDWLRSSARGYRVSADEQTLDLAGFRVLTGRARSERDPAEQLSLFTEALALWRGPVAEDVTDELGSDPVIEAVNREHADVAIEAAGNALAHGRPAAVLPALKLAARMHPTDEVVCALLMRCLAATGQQAAALMTFESLRVRLSDQLGVSPGPVLARAHLDVLRDKAASPPRPPGLPVPRQLPADLAGFTGREDEVGQLVSVLAAGPGGPAVSVLTGTAGVGKTALAVHAAHAVAGDFPDGQLYADLRGFGTSRAVAPSDVLGQFLTALGIPADRIPATGDERAALYRSALGERRVLVVLDNARDSAQVLGLLPGSGPSRAIITSRWQLRGLAVSGAQVLPLDLLDAGECERFLRSRLPGAQVDGERAAVASLIAISGGLPLALSLLAARAAQATAVPLSDIAAAAGDPDSSLEAFTDRADPRTSIRAVLSWSYTSLSAAAARMFTVLAVHPSPSVPADQAAALAGLDVPAARDLLDELVEANIAAERAGGRVWRHDLLRQYSAELLAAAGTAAREEAEERLYEYVTARAVNASSALMPGRAPLPGMPEQQSRPGSELLSESAATAWFASEYETAISLITRAPLSGRYDSHIWKLARALGHYLDRRGLWHESHAVHAAGLQAARRLGSTPAGAAMHLGIARAHSYLGRLDAAAHETRSALRDLGASPDAAPALASELHRQLCWILDRQGDLHGALREAQRALDLHPDDSHPIGRAHALNGVGFCEARLGMHDEALAHCTAAVSLLEQAPTQHSKADLWDSLGFVHACAGNVGEATRAYEHAIGLFRALGARFGEADSSLSLGLVLMKSGHLASARHFLETAHRLFGELGLDQSATAADALARIGRGQAGDARAAAG